MPRATLTTTDRRTLVLGAAVAMVLAQLGFRAWAVYGGWFYGDDFRLYREARASGWSPESLVAPYDAQLMPGGRLVALVAATPDQLSWPLLATSTLLAQALASAACAWMLLTLFGRRWGVLVPLAVYLSSAMTMPAFMWWAASLNQVPLQAVFFAAVACWVRYLRSRDWPWLALTLLVLAAGACFYVKTLLVLPVLAFLAVGWFASGGPVRRVVGAVRRYWVSAAVGVVAGSAYLAYYLLEVPQATGGEEPTQPALLAERMIGTVWSVGVLGGPWRWDEAGAPVARADPPAWAVHAAWVAIALVVAYLVLRRTRTVRAWVLLGGYVVADYALLLITRAGFVGIEVGAEYRYLTDSVPVLALALGLATLPLRGATEPSEERVEPLLTVALGRRTTVALTALVTVSGLVSSWRYADVWHDRHPGRDYLGTAVADLDAVGEIDLAAQVVPPEVMPPFVIPYTSTSVLLPLLTPAPEFPEETPDLHLLDADGHVRPAELDVSAESLAGPEECGWPVRAAGATIDLTGPTFDFVYWLHLSYLSSSPSAVTVSAGDSTVATEVLEGPGELWVRVEGVVDEVRVDGLQRGTTLCVEEVEVGEVHAEGEEP